MKLKLTFIILLGLITTSATFGQKAGLKGGANFTNLYVEDVDDENMKIGFNVGAYYRGELAENISIQPEFLFSQKGSELHYDGSIFGGSGKYRYNLNYLETPILFVGHFGNFNIHAGPYLGLLVGVNVKDVDDDGSVNEVESLDRDDFNTLDVGVAGGIGFDFDSGVLGLRYNYGFQEIGEEGSFAGEATKNSKNSALQLYIGFDF